MIRLFGFSTHWQLHSLPKAYSGQLMGCLLYFSFDTRATMIALPEHITNQPITTLIDKSIARICLVMAPTEI